MDSELSGLKLMRLSNGLDMVGEKEGGVQVASYVSGLYNCMEVPLTKLRNNRRGSIWRGIS